MNKLPAIDRYIARLIFFPMLGTLVLSAMLLVLEKMLRGWPPLTEEWLVLLKRKLSAGRLPPGGSPRGWRSSRGAL